MIITTEDTFSRKSKSSVKLIPDIPISSSRNYESLKSDLLEQPEAHFAESNITSNQGRSPKRLTNSTKRTMNHIKRPPSNSDSCSLSFVQQINEFPIYINNFQEKPNLKKDTSTSSYKIQSVCRFSKSDSIGDSKSYLYNYLHSKRNGRKLISSDSIIPKKNDEISSVLKDTMQRNNGFKSSEHFSEPLHREKYIATVDDSIQLEGNEFHCYFQDLQKTRQEEIIVFNVNCIENPKKGDIKYPNNRYQKETDVSLQASCDCCLTQTTKNLQNSELNECNDSNCSEEKESSAGKLEDDSNLPLGHSVRCKPCNMRDSSIKMQYFKSKSAERCPRHSSVTKTSYYNPSTSRPYMSSHFYGCNEYCLGSINESRTKTPNIKVSPQSIQFPKTDFCGPFPNSDNIHQKYSPVLKNIQSQDKPHITPENHYFRPEFGSHFLYHEPPCSCERSKKLEKEIKVHELSVETADDNLQNFTENKFVKTFLTNYNTADQALANEKLLNNIKPVERKKRHCTMCRTGVVDEGELSFDSPREDPGDERDISPRETNHDGTTLKLNRISKEKNEKLDIKNEDSLQTKEHETPNDTMLVGSIGDSPILPSETTEPPKKVPSQSIQNTKTNFCECCLNYVNNDQKYIHNFEDVQNQGIHYKIHKHCFCHPKPESLYLCHRPQQYIFGACKCKSNIRLANEFKEDENLIKRINENLVKTIENVISTKFRSNDNTLKRNSNDNLLKMGKNIVDKKIPGEDNVTLKRSVVNEELIKTLKPLKKKERSCTFCRSGRADEGELSFSPEYEEDVQKKDINYRTADLIAFDHVILGKNEQVDEVNQNNFNKNNGTGIISTRSITEATKSVEYEAKKIEDTNENLLKKTEDVINTKFRSNDNTLKRNSNDNLLKMGENIVDKKIPGKDNVTLKRSVVHEELINSLKPLKKKERSCTFCRSGRADEGELSISPEYEEDVQKKDIHYRATDLIALDHVILGKNEQVDEVNQNNFNKNNGTAIISTRSITEVTKSVEYESKKIETPCTYDIGRNITIQIIPNCTPSNTCYEPRTVFPPREHVSSPFNGFNEYTASESPKNVNTPEKQLDSHVYKREYTKYNPLHESGSDNTVTYMTTRDQCWRSLTKARQLTKWWNCSFRRKKYECPYYRTNARIAQDYCTNIDYSTIEPADCQRVIPIKNNYRMMTMRSNSTRQNCSKMRTAANRNENILRYMDKLNKNIIQDLLATPCPSSSAAYVQSRIQEIKKTCTCANLPRSSDNIKPFTMNQYCQCESNFHNKKQIEGIECNTSTTIENKRLYEYLRHLTKKISYLENRFEYDDNEYGNGCSQNFNGCCCCDRFSTCCCYCSNPRANPQELEKKKIKPCNESKSVEVIHSLRNCGTSTSKDCFKENAYTNTEIRPHISKAVIRRKYRHCCRSSNCRCCQQTLCCRCETEPNKKFCENTPQPPDDQYDNEIQPEYIMYCCQCEHRISLCQSEIELKKNNYVIMETKDTSTTEYQSVKSSQCNETKSEVKSTNTTNTAAEYTPISNDELMKSLTLDLCSLGDKTLSKFGVPSRQYPWSNNIYLPNMPNEIYRFIKAESYHTPITDQINDPTPCLKPEVVNINCTKNIPQNFELIGLTDKFNLPDASGDIKDDNIVKNKCLSAICESIFCSEERRHGEFRNSVDLGWTANSQLKFSSEPSFPNCTESDGLSDEKKCSHTVLNRNNINRGQDPKQESRKLHINDDKKKIENFEEDITPQEKMNLKKVKSRIKLTNKKVIESSELKKYQKTKPVTNSSIGNSSTYMSKPFTTRTGLMSFIPPFRDSFRSCTQVHKTKQKIQVGSLNKANVKKITTIQKPRNVENISEERNSKNIEDKKELNGEMSKPKSNIKTDNHEMQSNQDYLTSSTKSESREHLERIEEATTNSDTQINAQDQLTYYTGKNNETSNFSAKPINLNKPDKGKIKVLDHDTNTEKQNILSQENFHEIYSFYDKCYKPSNDPKTVMSVPYFKTNVADIVKSLEFRRNSTTKSFLHSLVGAVINTEDQIEPSLNNFLFGENIKANVELSDRDYNAQLYEQFFKESSYQNAVQIPQKILSKTDLISLK